MEPLFLVVDVGSSGAKAFLVDAAGGIVTRAESPWERDRWLADSGWCSIIQAVRDAIGDRKLIQDSLRAVSVTSMREEFVLLDGSGSEVKAELNEESYRFGERIVEEHGELMYDLSGHWPVPNWIAGAVLPWMRAECSGFREARRFLMMADWVVYKLSGVACTEGSNACETSMYDVYRNDWAWELIDDLLLPRGIFPPVKRSGEALGTVTREASKDTGIPTDALVVTGGADTQCGLMGMGAQPGEAGLITNYIGVKAGLGDAKSALDAFRADLPKMSPKMAEAIDPNAVVAWFWSVYPFTLGSYAGANVGQYTTMLEVASEPALDGRLQFAGEHTSSDFLGFMNGGVESGNRAAAALVEVMALQK